MGIVIKSTHSQVLQIPESVAEKKKKVKICLLFLIANEYIENVPHSLLEIKACLIEAHFHTIS